MKSAMANTSKIKCALQKGNSKCKEWKVLYFLPPLFVIKFSVKMVVFLISELLYEDIFVVWETIWAAMHCSTDHFVLFIALALLQFYR